MRIRDHARRAWRRMFLRAPKPVTPFDPYALLSSPILEGACVSIEVCGVRQLGHIVALDRANVTIRFEVPDVLAEQATIPLRIVEGVRLAGDWEVDAHREEIVAEWGQSATALRSAGGPWKRTAMNGDRSPS